MLRLTSSSVVSRYKNPRSPVTIYIPLQNVSIADALHERQPMRLQQPVRCGGFREPNSYGAKVVTVKLKVSPTNREQGRSLVLMISQRSSEISRMQCIRGFE